VNQFYTSTRRRKNTATTSLDALADATDIFLFARSAEAGLVAPDADPAANVVSRMAEDDVARALAAVTDSSPVIAITHNPDVFPQIQPRVALTLAGHTHGGQVRLPLIGAPIVPSDYGQRFAAGHIVEGGRHLFVSTGLGTSDLPVRLGVPPTIFLLTITGPKSSSAAPRPARTAAPGYAPRSAPGRPSASSASTRR